MLEGIVRSSLWQALLGAAVLCALPGAALASGIYKYVEKDGTIVYTNVLPAAARKAHRMAGELHPAPSKSVEALSAPDRASLAPLEFNEVIELAAHRYKIPASLVRAVMHAESNYDTRAVSPKGASGLMQLMPTTAQEMYVKDIFDARENILGGTRYLRVLANQFDGDMVKMVAAYNAGPEAVKRSGGEVPPFAETQEYVKKVIALYFQYKSKAQAQVER